ncbi:ABC transporter ATP-binding protein/permease [Acidiferrimicrobium sp. IK]|uniref:ABC transporter ATP-binding protein n=1 Tax=Acidiferrimicrobium sp. IK TaxID=2871700 RepID=UPI0021CB2E25|nr:ABC transporter ATP-binding protein [Acidiferrimicrobium sp. IK]MCU4184123.1 ABC transporter ATP-binding protein/permease [Acidiferrimicrobium sp. IK]
MSLSSTAPPSAAGGQPGRDARRPGWIRRMAPWLAPYRRNVVLAFGAALVGSAVTAAAPAIQRQVVDNVIIHHRSPLAPWLALLAGAAVVNFVAAYVRRFVGGRVSLDVQYDLRNAIYDQLQRLDFARHDELQTGQLVSRANSDVGLLQGLLAFLPMMSGNVLLLVVSIAVMFVLSPMLALISLAVVPVMIVTAYRMRAQTFPANWDAQQKEGEVAVVVEEGVTGIRVVKGFGQERREVDHLVAKARALYGSRLRAVRLQARYQPVLQTVPVLGQVAVLGLGGWLAIDGRITIGTFLAFSTYLAQLSAPARMLAAVLLVGQQARAGAERVLDLLAVDPTVDEAPDADVLPPVRGEITFEHVSFEYRDGRRVLDDFDLSIASGERVAIVGASGSGKSTVAMLVPRFYDASHGTVRVDGVDVRSVTLTSLRRQIGVVFEESFLFSDTVRANIAFGRPDASDEEVKAAARAARAEGFIEALPDGYDTVVGERGMSLSGGQRQRVTLARALLTDPRVLILDDATSAVDAQTEEDIHDALRALLAGRTTLLVAHRRSTLGLADRIVVLDGGRVLDQGSHETLIGRCPAYRRLLASPGDELAEGPEPGEGHGMPAGSGDDGPIRPGAADPVMRVRPTPARVAPAAGAGAGAAMGGPGNWMGGLAATPDLLEKVAALAPATDTPDIDVDGQRAYDPDFSLRHFVRPFRRQLGLGLTLVLLDALATLAGPVLIRAGLDDGVAKASGTALAAASIAFLAVTAADLIDTVVQVLVTGRTAERLLFALRVRIWSQLMRLSVDFYDREMGGRIMTRMTTDVDALSTLLQTGLINALVAMFTFVGVGVALAVWNWELALTTMSVVVPLAGATVAYRRLSGRAYRSARERISVVNATMQESLSGVRETHAFDRSAHNQDHFHSLAARYLEARLGAQRLVATYFPFVQFLSDVAGILVLAVGSALVRGHSLTAGELVGFLLYLDVFFSPIQQLSQTFDSYQQAGASVAQINALMAQRPLVELPDEPVRPPRLQGRVSFDAVRFSYPGGPEGQEALRGVTLTIEPGQTVALVGETGAGKSTIIKLVTRFYDPTGGAVRIDGIDLRQIDLEALRQQLGYVPQEAFLFSGTLRDNIAYGRPDATDAEVRRAAAAVGADAFVRGLPDGYDTVVSERGRSLSSGQRQLIALARAELVDPAVLLLDEATSNLDLATEERVSRAMGVVAHGRTTILIAHRLQTAARADRVVVMDHGVVVEDGSPDDLLLAGGPYARLWALAEAGSLVE